MDFVLLYFGEIQHWMVLHNAVANSSISLVQDMPNWHDLVQDMPNWHDLWPLRQYDPCKHLYSSLLHSIICHLFPQGLMLTVLRRFLTNLGLVYIFATLGIIYIFAVPIIFMSREGIVSLYRLVRSDLLWLVEYFSWKCHHLLQHTYKMFLYTGNGVIYCLLKGLILVILGDAPLVTNMCDS